MSRSVQKSIILRKYSNFVNGNLIATLPVLSG